MSVDESTQITHANAETRYHSPDHKAQNSNQVQTTSWRTVRGYLESPSHHCNHVCHNFHRHNCHHLTGSRSWYLRNLQWHCFKKLAVRAGKLWILHSHTNPCKPGRRHKKKCNAPIHTDVCPLISPGHLFCSHYRHAVKILCPWNCILATIQSQA